MAKQYWLMKSEPDEFGIDDLERVEVEPWSGVRNYQARNFMRDQMKVEDEILFYHSSCKPAGVAGIATVASAPYADPSQFDKKSPYYDEKSNKDNPRWILVDVKFKKKLKKFVSLKDLKAEKALSELQILRKGNRLSITPVSKEEYQYILKMGA